MCCVSPKSIKFYKKTMALLRSFVARVALTYHNLKFMEVASVYVWL